MIDINDLPFQLSDESTAKLECYADCVWQKKDSLNLTSVRDKEEIFIRHILDGLWGASYIRTACAEEGRAVQSVTVADIGAGAGYIGMAIAAALPDTKVSLVESLEKRCAFMSWAALKAGITNIEVINARAGEGKTGKYDFVLERAMGKIEDILPVCLALRNEGGSFAAYQSAIPDISAGYLAKLGVKAVRGVSYMLPNEEKERFLAVFR
ncbi:16S rRNA (guanine527-N7)-methyltransferase [Parelusimicrobium proximum]|uniref:16S rRNA (guanine(527)-N(7))-methyltransferase RsmG n=1 Tax=Parelusimicrobium proximum TaxID=3228953 RepID=UPI003D170B77